MNYRTFLGGMLAVSAVRAAVQSAHHISNVDDLILVLTAGLFGGLAAVLLKNQPAAGIQPVKSGDV